MCCATWRRLVGAVLFLVVSEAVALEGTWVVPVDEVTRGVNIRASASSDSEAIGLLAPGEHLVLLGEIPHWYEVELADARTGYVSKRWTQLIPPPAAPSETRWTLQAVDVGTGLALLVQGPDFVLVYDAGSNDDRAKGEDNRFVAYLQSAFPDLGEIEHLVLSHPHRDHVELLPDVLERYHVENVWDSGRFYDSCPYRAFITAVAESEDAVYHSPRSNFGPVRFDFSAPKTCNGYTTRSEMLELDSGSRIETGQTIQLGENATMQFLYATSEDHGSPNENSLVLRVDLAGTRILLMGDAEAGGRKLPSDPPAADAIEGRLLACCEQDLRADVLVVGHHGSMTSSRDAFLDAVDADTYIVSSGPQKYGSVTLPDDEVLNTLLERGDVFGTYMDDGACANDARKIGPDNDGKPGGCDNIIVTFGGGTHSAEFSSVND